MTSSTAATTRPAARRAAAWVPGLTTVSASRLTRGVRKPPTRPKAPSSRARWVAVCTRSSCSGVTSTSGSRMLSWAARRRTGGVARQRVCVCYGEGACVTMGRWHLPRELGRPLCSHRLGRLESRSGRSGLNQPGSCFRHTSEVKRATGEGARPRLAADSIAIGAELLPRGRPSEGGKHRTTLSNMCSVYL